MARTRNAPDHPVRAHAYIRVSTEMQASEGTSLEVQEERCRAEAKRRGWELVALHTDAGVSGAKADRPALTELLEAVRRDEVDAILVTKLDRLGRSQRNLVPLLAELDDRGVIFLSLHESFDASTPYGRVMRTMIGGFAELERDLISERTRTGSRKRAEMGGRVGGIPPFGYVVDSSGPFKRLVPDKEATAFIELLLKMLLDDGVRITEACKRLNALGMTPRKSPLWNTVSLRTFLVRNQFDGQWVYCKPARRVSGEPIKVTLEPIVTPERMAQLRAYLAATTRPHTSGQIHPLRGGKLICVCGSHMFGLQRGDRSNRRYKCLDARHVPGKPYCHEPTLLAEEVEHAVWAQLLKLLDDPDALLAAAAEMLEPQASDGVPGSLEDAQAAVERSREAVADATVRGFALGLDYETLQLTITKLNDQLAAVIRHRDALTSNAAVAGQADQWLQRVQRLADYAHERLQDPDRQLRADVFEALDIKVYVKRHDPPAEAELLITGAIPIDFPAASDDWHIASGAHARTKFPLPQGQRVRRAGRR